MTALARSRSAWSGNFFFVDQLHEATTDAERAGILLRLPDALVAAEVEQLQAACVEGGFPLGRDYLAIRHSQQSAVRDRQGNLPDQVAEQLEYWRRGMVAISESAK